MVRTVVPRLGGVCAIAGLLIGCGVDEIDHLPGHGTTGSLSDSTFEVDVDGGPFGGEVSGGGGFGDTNFDEAVLRCGGLDDLAAPIDGLRSAWAVVALPDSTYRGEAVDAGSIRVRLGAQPLFDCQDAFGPATCDGGGSSSSGSPFITGAGGECGWGFSFTLEPTEVHTGARRLEDLLDPDFELAIEESVSGPITGELTIVNVTPECIVGELSGVAFDDYDVPSLSGSFAAERCDRTCLPGPGRECD